MLCLGVNDMSREMKDSRVEWLGEIPKDWKVTKIKHKFKIVAGATPKSEQKENFDGNIIWITPADYKTTDKYVFDGKRKLSNIGYESCNTTIVPAGSIIFSKRAPIGSVAIAQTELCTNQGCLSCVKKEDVDERYFYFLMSILTEEFELLGTGTTFKEISAFSFENFRMPYPDVAEQIKIANYIESKCDRIDLVINKTQNSIKQYKELKKSIVTRTIINGIKVDCKMKKSGIKWLEKIPENWTVEKGKNLFRETNERSVSGKEELLTVSHITGVTPRKEKNVNMFMSESLIDYKICHEGDIAANTMWMWQGAIGVSKYHGVVSPSYNTYRQKSDIYDLNYLEYLLRIPPLVDTYAAYSTGITASRLRLYPQGFLSIYFPVPPKKEQQEIVSYLNDRIPQINQLIIKKEEFIEELKNYKKSLIYEYVTGKKEVPES